MEYHIDGLCIICGKPLLGSELPRAEKYLTLSGDCRIGHSHIECFLQRHSAIFIRCSACGGNRLIV